MKRFLGIILALALVLSPAVPALAYETPPNLEQEYEEGWEEATPFEQGYQEAYDKAWEEGYVQGLADGNGTYGITEPYDWAYHQEHWESWKSGSYEDGRAIGARAGYENGYDEGFYGFHYRAGQEAGYAQGMADAQAGVDNDGGLAWDEDDANDVKKAYYQAGYRDGYYRGWQAHQETAERQEQIRAVGGVPGEMNVMLNGTCIAFPDAYPEMLDGRTMVPVRAVTEALGAKVSYLEGGVVQISLDGAVLTLPPGEKTVTVVSNGESREIAMDCAAYIKEARTYVPLRFVSEALGLDVYWDEAFKTVVLLDRDAAIDQINEEFEIYNLLLESQKKNYEGNKRIDTKFSLSVEFIDSIDGNKKHTISGSADIHLGGGAVTVDGALDLRAFSAMAKPLYLNSFHYIYNDGDAVLERLDTISDRHTFSLKASPQGELYVQMPLLTQLQNLESKDLKQGEEDVWYHLSGLDASVFDLGAGSVGEMTYQRAMAYNNYVSPFYYCESMKEMAGALTALVGDDRFQKTGNTYKLTINLDTIAALMELDEEELEQARMMLPVCSVTISIRTDGSYEVSGQVKANLDGLIYGLGSMFNMELYGRGSSEGDQISVLYQIRNLLNLTVRGESSITSTTRAPDYQIPEGAKVIELE